MKFSAYMHLSPCERKSVARSQWSKPSKHSPHPINHQLGHVWGKLAHSFDICVHLQVVQSPGQELIEMDLRNGRFVHGLDGSLYVGPAQFRRQAKDSSRRLDHLANAFHKFLVVFVLLIVVLPVSEPIHILGFQDGGVQNIVQQFRSTLCYCIKSIVCFLGQASFFQNSISSNQLTG